MLGRVSLSSTLRHLDNVSATILISIIISYDIDGIGF